MTQSWRKKISIFFIILMTVFLLPVLLFIFAGMMASSVSLPQDLAQPPMNRLDFVFGPAPGQSGTPRTADVKTTASQPAAIATPPAALASSPAPARGAVLWVQIIRENKNFFRTGYPAGSDEFEKVFPYNPDLTRPVTVEQARWLQSKNRLIQRLLELSQAGPFVTWNEPHRLGLALDENVLFSSVLQCRDIMVSLLGEYSRWRRQERDYAAAGNALLAALQISDVLDRNSYTTDYQGFLAVEPYLHEAIRDPGWLPDQIKTLLDELEGAERWRLPQKGISRLIANMYLQERAMIVAEMNQATWKSRVYGYDLNSNMTKYWGPLPFGPRNKSSLEIPHPLRMLGTSLTAMRNKTRAAEALRHYDETWLRLVEASGKPYPDWRTARKELTSAKQLHTNFLFTGDVGFGPGSGMFSILWHDLTNPVRIRQAQIHLARLGLLWRLDPKGTMGARKEKDLSSTPHDPWRDPFTEKSMCLDDSTSQTLIYSLGPDLKDRHGTKIMDMSNPFGTAGNIVIRLPQR